MTATGTLIGGKYRLNREIGEGAMGIVWEATHEFTGREVAVKLIRKSTPEARHRLMREARACGKLRHRNIIEVLDVGEDADSGEPFLVMQLLHGETLQSLLARSYRLSPSRTAMIGVDIAQALDTAHEHGIVHRDLKPANIFLHHEPGDSGFTLKVLDFGVSKHLFEAQSMATISGSMVGSLAYMSPEQVAAHKNVDHTSDIWSLGVMLFEMLVGRRPFLGAAQEVAYQILQSDIPKIRRFNRHIDPDLEHLVMHCLSRNRKERLQSARDLALGLRPFLGAEQNPDRPSFAHPISAERESKPAFARVSQPSMSFVPREPDTEPLPRTRKQPQTQSQTGEIEHGTAVDESNSDTIATIPRGAASMSGSNVFRPVKTTIKMKQTGVPAKQPSTLFTRCGEPTSEWSPDNRRCEVPPADAEAEKTALDSRIEMRLPAAPEPGQIEVPPDRASTNGGAMLPVESAKAQKRRGLLMMSAVALMSGLFVCVAGLVAHQLWVLPKAASAPQKTPQKLVTVAAARDTSPQHALTVAEGASIALPAPNPNASLALPMPSLSTVAPPEVPSVNKAAPAASTAFTRLPPPAAQNAPKAPNTNTCDPKTAGCKNEAKKPIPATSPGSLPPIFELPDSQHEQSVVF